MYLSFPLVLIPFVITMILSIHYYYYSYKTYIGISFHIGLSKQNFISFYLLECVFISSSFLSKSLPGYRILVLALILKIFFGFLFLLKSQLLTLLLVLWR